MTVLNWYAVGSCSVTNNNPVVTGTATSWLQNVDPREGFRGPDGLIYEIASIDSDTQLTLATNYKGVSSGGGLPYSICPLTGYERSLAADAASLLTKAGALLNQSPTTLDILQYRGTTWVTRSLSQYALDLHTGPAEINAASAATCDIGAATSHRVAITGTSTITSLGTTLNCIRFVRFTGILILTHNASSLILPAGINITTAVGDTAIFVSDGSGNWRCMKYGGQLFASFAEVLAPNKNLSDGLNGDSQVHIAAMTNDAAAIDVGGAIGMGGFYNGTTTRQLFGAIAGRKANSAAGNASGYLAFFINNNTALVDAVHLSVGGGFSCLRGTTAPVASGTPVTLFGNASMHGAFGAYLVIANVVGAAGPTIYTAWAMITYDPSGAGNTALIDGANTGFMTISLSGNNIQATQGSGAVQQIEWAAFKIGA